MDEYTRWTAGEAVKELKVKRLNGVHVPPSNNISWSRLRLPGSKLRAIAAVDGEHQYFAFFPFFSRPTGLVVAVSPCHEHSARST